METNLPQRRTVLNAVRLFGFALLLMGATLAHSKVEPWCAPVSVKLGFLDEQGRDAVRLELRSPTRTCTNNELDESVGLYRERGLSIEFYGSTIRIPSSCLKGLSF